MKHPLFHKTYFLWQFCMLAPVRSECFCYSSRFSKEAWCIFCLGAENSLLMSKPQVPFHWAAVCLGGRARGQCSLFMFRVLLQKASLARVQGPVGKINLLLCWPLSWEKHCILLRILERERHGDYVQQETCWQAHVCTLSADSLQAITGNHCCSLQAPFGIRGHGPTLVSSKENIML